MKLFKRVGYVTLSQRASKLLYSNTGEKRPKWNWVYRFQMCRYDHMTTKLSRMRR